MRMRFGFGVVIGCLCDVFLYLGRARRYSNGLPFDGVCVFCCLCVAERWIPLIRNLMAQHAST